MGHHFVGLSSTDPVFCQLDTGFLLPLAPLSPANPEDFTGSNNDKLLLCKGSELLREAAVHMAVQEGDTHGGIGAGSQSDHALPIHNFIQ